MIVLGIGQWEVPEVASGNVYKVELMIKDRYILICYKFLWSIFYLSLKDFGLENTDILLKFNLKNCGYCYCCFIYLWWYLSSIVLQTRQLYFLIGTSLHLIKTNHDLGKTFIRRTPYLYGCIKLKVYGNMVIWYINNILFI